MDSVDEITFCGFKSVSFNEKLANSRNMCMYLISTPKLSFGLALNVISREFYELIMS